MSFSAADNLSAMKIALSESEALHLRGRIDRMDVCEDGGKVYVKIIDYKSGSTSFDLLALLWPAAPAGGLHGCSDRDGTA